MLILAAADVRQALPMPDAIAAMREAFAALAGGRARVPMRGVLDVEPYAGTTLVMPSFLGGDGDATDDALAVKVVSVFPRNPSRGLPLIHAAVVVLEPDTGRVVALLEGGTLTAIRTGAASGLATDLLARSDARAVAMLGCGVQARTQLEAVCAVRDVGEVRVYGPTAAHVEEFIADVAGRERVPADLRAASSADEAVAHADIVCAATTSAEPVFDDGSVRPGTHINAIGSFQPDVREIPAATVLRAVVVVDDRAAALEEAGDLILPLREGLISATHIRADLGELVSGRASGRRSDDEVTLFKSVGVAVQDAAAARVALRRAEARGLGHRAALES